MAENLENVVNNHAGDEIKTNVWERKIFQVVREGVAIVKYNIYNGQYTTIDKVGFKLNLNPLNKYKTVPTTVQYLDTPPVNALDKDNIHLSCDTDYVYRISNPATYIKMLENESLTNDGKTTVQIIGKLLDNCVRTYLKTTKAEDFLTRSTEDITRLFTDELRDIERKYGVTVETLVIKDVRLPKEISDIGEKRKVEEQNQQLAEAKKRTRQIELETELLNEQQKIKLEEERIEAIIRAAAKATKDAGGSVQDMINMIGTRIVQEGLVNGSNPNTFVVASALEQSVNNGQLNPAAMAGIISATGKKVNNQTIDPINDQNVNQQSNSNPVSETSENMGDKVPLEAEQELVAAHLADPTSVGKLSWSGLSTASYDYLIAKGYKPPVGIENKNKQK